MNKQTPLAYIKSQLFPNSSSIEFVKEWKTLSDEDKTELKAYAQEEIDALA